MGKQEEKQAIATVRASVTVAPCFQETPTLCCYKPRLQLLLRHWLQVGQIVIRLGRLFSLALCRGAVQCGEA